MKSLEQIKNEYAVSKKFKSWEYFCSVANDNMFVRAVDEIATLYAEYRTRLTVGAQLVAQSVTTNQLLIERFG